MAVLPGRTLILTERRPRLCRLAPETVSFLLREHAAHVELAPTGQRHRYRLTPGGVAGVLIAPGCRLVIRPKLPLRNLFFLLEPTASPPTAADAITPTTGTELLDFLAGHFHRLLEKRIASGLHRAYVERPEEGPILHGRLDLPAQLRAAPGRKDRLHAQLDDLTIDLPCNQALRTTTEQLLQSPFVSEVVRAALRSVLRALDGVSPLPGDLEALVALPSGRLPADYGPLLDLCRLLLSGLQPTTTAGPTASPAFLLDMERVFERYLTRGVVAAFVGEEHFTIGIQVGRTIPGIDAGQPDFLMRPDLSIDREGKSLLVVDAKWKRLPAASLVTPDVYQVLAYSLTLGASAAALVYPGRRTRTWRYALPRSPVRLLVQTLNVCGSREGCERSLRRLVGEWKRQLRQDSTSQRLS